VTIITINFFLIVFFLFFFQYNDTEFTLWDSFPVQGKQDDGSEMTLQQLKDLFQVVLS